LRLHATMRIEVISGQAVSLAEDYHL